jgi:3-dehydroquinate synthase
MDFLQQSFQVKFEYKVFFTEHLFNPDNSLFIDFFRKERKADIPPKILFVIDDNVSKGHPKLWRDIVTYCNQYNEINLINEAIMLPGGEGVKNDERWFYLLQEAVNTHKIDRHSYLVAIGGGAVLDLAGYAAAVAHRGVRHIRIPTTVLSQNDSGVGVKNGINFFRKKNFLGTFAPPVAVINDLHFLTSLDDGEWRSGMSEAIKVALIKDPTFFYWLTEHADRLAKRDMPAMKYLIKRCAELHLEHIRSKDPFESGSSRPLDFGHWSAHKLEQLTDFAIRHGDAVAIGIALDSVYSHLTGRLSSTELEMIISVIKRLGFAITHPLLEVSSVESPLLRGLEEFREHLGGKLTITLLNGIGKGEEVHSMDGDLIRKSGEWLQRIA